MERLKLIKQKDEILELLDNGNTPQQIANIINEDVQCIRSVIKKFRGKILFRPNKGNVHYFDTIDSNSKAYIVGFIAADGAIVSNGGKSLVLTITIKYEDKAVLEFIKSEIGNAHKLLEINRPNSFDKSKNIHHIRYSIADKYIVSALNNLGITQNKSLTMGNIINNIPLEYRDAFIIGYFDGDGSVTTNDKVHPKFSVTENKIKYYPDHSIYAQFRGTKEFLSGICLHLDISDGFIKSYDSIPCLSFANKKDIVKLFNCYKGLQFFYKRKHDKFLERINHVSFDKYK